MVHKLTETHSWLPRKHLKHLLKERDLPSSLTMLHSAYKALLELVTLGMRQPTLPRNLCSPSPKKARHLAQQWWVYSPRSTKSFPTAVESISRRKGSKWPKRGENRPETRRADRKPRKQTRIQTIRPRVGEEVLNSPISHSQDLGRLFCPKMGQNDLLRTKCPQSLNPED